MGNTHLVPDMAYELQATCYDLLPACIVSTSWPVVPVPPGLTLAAFATAGYVKDGPTLTYCAQEAHTVTLVGGDGNFWLALSQDSFTTYASWNRVPGTQYLWRASATRPPDIDGLLVAISVTVAGGNVTAVAPASGVTRAEALRALSGLGTLATQDASAVAVTGGSATGLTTWSAGGVSAPSQGGLLVADAAAGNASAWRSQTTAGTGRFQLYLEGTATNYLNGRLGIQHANPQPPDLVRISHRKADQHALSIQPSDSDTGPGIAVLFQNVAGTPTGSITTTGSATAYNTSSDGRLKEALVPLANALAVLQALTPVTFRWKRDGSPGVGFVAQDVQPVVPEAVTGTPEAPEPMAMDLSKLVPYLVSALQELVARVGALEAR